MEALEVVVRAVAIFAAPTGTAQLRRFSQLELPGIDSFWRDVFRPARWA